MYEVFDYYENPFGERVFVSHSRKECEKFCEEFECDTDGECNLVIRPEA